jgi:UDP-N-acetylglucosamine:LPS N-acetylglucosamine transferase
MKKVLCISSSGGHWVQLRKMTEQISGCELIYVSTDGSLESQVGNNKFYAVVDANMWSKLKMIKLLCQLIKIIIIEKPRVIISTGAAPGFFAILIGKLLNKKTIWIDSIANSEELSLAGRKVKSFATITLSQWEHLADDSAVYFNGSVL